MLFVVQPCVHRLYAWSDPTLPSLCKQTSYDYTAITQDQGVLVPCRKSGASGVMAEGKDRYQDYKTDAADGKVNWMQQGKDALTDYKADSAVREQHIAFALCELTLQSLP